MKFFVLPKGTKIRLTADWTIVERKIGRITIRPITIKAGTILSLYDLDIRSNSRTPELAIFKIPAKGCPSDPQLEREFISGHLTDLENLEFELGNKAVKQLSETEIIFKTIKQEIKCQL